MKNVIAFDSGLATFGAVVVGVGEQGKICRHADVFSSEPMKGLASWRDADDLVRRSRDLAKWLDDLLTKWSPAVVVCEVMAIFDKVKPQIYMSMGYGVMVALIQKRHNLPLLTVGARTWRKAICGESNEELAHQAAMMCVPSYRPHEKNIPPQLLVHARDALGVYCWWEKTTTNEIRWSQR